MSRATVIGIPRDEVSRACEILVEFSAPIRLEDPTKSFLSMEQRCRTGIGGNRPESTGAYVRDREFSQVVIVEVHATGDFGHEVDKPMAAFSNAPSPRTNAPRRGMRRGEVSGIVGPMFRPSRLARSGLGLAFPPV